MQSIAGVKLRDMPLSPVPPHTTGDYAVALFAYAKAAQMPPQRLADAVGEYLTNKHPTLVAEYCADSGFLNMRLTADFWTAYCAQWHRTAKGTAPEDVLPKEARKRILLEYCSPNTNKPLHLGHLRNLFIGDALARMLRSVGHQVHTACLLNDRGIPICQSMVAYQQEGRKRTPADSNKKGDHFVGDYYVRYHQLVDAQPDLAEQVTALLQRWEQKDPEVRALWARLNEWVADGFDATYARIGIAFDHIYKESDTYLLGKQMVQSGLSKGLFYKDKEGAVWVDLTQHGLDQKVLLRSDGTSVYITQDLGTHLQKIQDTKADISLYVVGNEQLYHFKVLFSLLATLGESTTNLHIAYGMVSLPSGRMKSRQGQVVDADDLLDEMERLAEQKTQEAGKLADIPQPERPQLYQRLGIGALKYYLLRVAARKAIAFDPDSSIDFEGMTATFIQYTYVRIRSLLRKAEAQRVATQWDVAGYTGDWSAGERVLLRHLADARGRLHKAAAAYDPSLWAMYLYELARAYNHYYATQRILTSDAPTQAPRRLMLSQRVAVRLQSGMALLGIEMPDRM